MWSLTWLPSYRFGISIAVHVDVYRKVASRVSYSAAIFGVILD